MHGTCQSSRGSKDVEKETEGRRGVQTGARSSHTN